MKKLMLIMLCIFLAVPATVFAATSVTYPGKNGIIYSNSILLSGTNFEADDYAPVYWAVRAGTDEAGVGTVAGNVDGKNDDYSWGDGLFSATIDVSELDGGQYYFVLNINEDRFSQPFYLVDGYAVVGGTVKMEGVDVPGKSPSHTLEGVVGAWGFKKVPPPLPTSTLPGWASLNTVGSVTVTYHELGETRVYEPTRMRLDPAEPAGGTEPNTVARLVLGNLEGTLLVLDNDPDTWVEYYFERGAVILFPRHPVIPHTDPLPPDYEPHIYGIDACINYLNADCWVGMDKGKNHVGLRQSIE